MTQEYIPATQEYVLVKTIIYILVWQEYILAKHGYISEHNHNEVWRLTLVSAALRLCETATHLLLSTAVPNKNIVLRRKYIFL